MQLSAATVYRKTAKGNEEIKAKRGGLDRKLRPLLILVDGRRDSDAIVALAAGIGVQASALKQLEADGYIEPVRVKSEAKAAAAVAGRGPATLSSGVPPNTLSAPTTGTLEPARPRTNLERFTDGAQYMNEAVTEALGVRALFFVLKIEKCSNRTDLIQLLPDFEKAIAKKHGPQYAAHCRLIAVEILAQ
jgi:hypothetical protein